MFGAGSDERGHYCLQRPILFERGRVGEGPTR